MKKMLHTYHFEPISNEWSLVHAHNSLTANQLQLQVCVRDNSLLSRHLSSVPPIIADLLDIAVAVHVGDRASERQKGVISNFHIVLPVRCPEILSQSEIVEKLHDVLHWYTGCSWHFEFIRRQALGRNSEQKLTLPLSNDSSTSVLLWSGGRSEERRVGKECRL